jgi:hypothetical protein
MAMFECDAGLHTVHYTLVCDMRKDCMDGTDESWCQHAACESRDFSCDKSRCFTPSQKCDGVRNCEDGKDEAVCSNLVSLIR